MSCEVASSPFADPGFASPFDVDNAHGDKTDIAALRDFNYNFAAGDHGCVDPQNLSNAGSLSGHFDPVMTPDYTPNNYPTDFAAIPASPYFHSVEQPFNVPAFPPHLQNQHLHRRSVSEPPDGALMHQRVPHSDAPAVLHRDGHHLGSPRADGPPLKRVKQSRVQRYQGHPCQPPPIQSRCQLKRNHIQPTHLPPTSVPRGLPVDQPPQLQQMHHVPFEQMPRGPHYVSSRVCTPTPEVIDPFLGASPTPAVANMGAHARMAFEGQHNNTPVAQSVTIKMGVEELRSLITEVVQKAVEGLQADKSMEAVDAVARQRAVDEVVASATVESTAGLEMMANGGMGDEIVAAASPTDDIVNAQADAKP